MVTLLLLSLVNNEKNTLGLPAISMTMRMRLAIRNVSPDRARPGLHAEPLDVVTGRLLAPYLPGASAIGIDGSNTTSTQKRLLALWYITAYANLVKKTQKGTSTQVIGNASL